MWAMREQCSNNGHLSRVQESEGEGGRACSFWTLQLWTQACTCYTLWHTVSPVALCLPSLYLLFALSFVSYRFVLCIFFSQCAKQTACCSVVLLGVAPLLLLLLSAHCDGHFRFAHTHARTLSHAHAQPFRLWMNSQFVSRSRTEIYAASHFNSTCCTTRKRRAVHALSLRYSPALLALSLSLRTCVACALSRSVALARFFSLFRIHEAIAAFRFVSVWLHKSSNPIDTQRLRLRQRQRPEFEAREYNKNNFSFVFSCFPLHCATNAVEIDLNKFK